MNGNCCSLTFGGCTAPSPALFLPAASRRSWERKGGRMTTRDGAQLRGEEEDGSIWLGSRLPWCLEADSSCRASPSSPEPFFLLLSPPRSPCCHQQPPPSEPQPHSCSQQVLQRGCGTSCVSLEEGVSPSFMAAETQGDQELDKTTIAVFPQQPQPPERHFPMGSLLLLFIF